jgi:hypothetical protein
VANDLGRINDISWSPDSKMVGFSAFKINPTLEVGIYTLGIDGNIRMEYTNTDWANRNTATELDASFLVWFYGWLK